MDKIEQISVGFQYDRSYLTKVTLASLISAFALIGNSQEGVIGSMLVSPIGGPVVALAASIYASNMTGAKNSIISLVLAFAIMIGVGAGVGTYYEKNQPTEEMKRRYTHPDSNTIVVAVIIGFCFALANSSSVAESIGAGIAISLLPPAVNYGITYMNKTISDEDKKEALKATLNISLYNISGIIIARLLVAVLNQNKIPLLSF